MSSNVTMKLFALEMQISVDCLIKHFLSVGIVKNKFDVVTLKEREVLLNKLNCDNVSTFYKFLLRRQTRSTVNVLSGNGQNKQVQIEIRRKQMYVLSRHEQENDIALTKQITLSKYGNEFNTNNKLMDSITESKTIIDKSHNFNAKYARFDSTIKNEKTLSQTIKKNIHQPSIEEGNHILPIKPNFNIHNKLRQIRTISDSYFDKSSKLSIICSNKPDSGSPNKLDNKSMFEVDRSNDYKFNREKRYDFKTRVKQKTIGKALKQKKNNEYSSSYVAEVNEFNGEKQSYSISKRISKSKRKQSILVQSFKKPTQIIKRDIVIGESISVLELSNKISIKSSYMIKFMMQLGLMVTINQIIDQETAQLVIEEMGHNAILRRENELEELVMNNNNNSFITSKNNHIMYEKRAPIITVMGHVDHGKTSLLDYIRSTHIIDTESGGITQSMKAYRVTTKEGKLMTFVDTPGHAAFTQMRMRGVQLTDIVILVIAADDGVMPQTIESIQYIKSAKVPVIVAINKVDKVDINIDRIKYELNRYGLIPEEWGGDTFFINISAISGLGINSLLDAILLQSEIIELKTKFYGMAKAIVIESLLDKGKGPVSVVLIREGELKCGDIILCGTEYGRVRSIRNEYGKEINMAYPSMPVEILGLSGAPLAGEMMIVVSDEKKARDVAVYRKNKCREIKLSRKRNESITTNIFSESSDSTKIIELNFIVKSDTQGTLEAICECIKKLSRNKIVIKILSASIGNIRETDAILALTSKAVILGFNIKSDSAARRIINLNKLDIYYSSIIYDLLDEVERIIQSSISTVDSVSPNFIGIAEVHNIFRSTIHRIIAGCIVVDGIIKSQRKMIIFRNNVPIYKGELESLRRFKNDVNEVRKGMECGIGIKNYSDIKPGDTIKVLDMVVMA